MRGIVLCVLVAGGVAHANGRAPTTNGMYFKPGDAHSLYVRSTFGLLISHDDGCTFDWICEDNIGYSGNFDPDYAITSDGTIFATTPHGLRASHDGGCSFATVTPDESVDSLDLSSTGAVWIGTATAGVSNDIYQSIDGGATFQSVGLATSVAFYKSVKTAPTDAMRVYVTSNQNTGALPDGGESPPEAHLLRSDDAGSQWATEPLTGVTFAPFPLVTVAAVDPANENVVYVVSVGANQSTGDLLFRSTDGAVTFTPVLATANQIRDVVIIDAHVFVTTIIHLTNGSETGGPAFASGDGGLAFAPLAGAPLLDCLAHGPDGTLHGCGANWDPDFKAVAKSPDGSSWQKVWRFVELAGPLSCPEGTVEHDTCEAKLWPGVQTQFGTTGPSCGADASDGAQDGAPPPKKTGCCDSGGGGPISLIWASAIALWLSRRHRE